ncbi:hypothetical protein [Nonlabens sp.]|uniref:hypothetical protein n=1 Tax=Nonlabens sp. TaxID=1888209 RepID=UPI003F69CD0B
MDNWVVILGSGTSISHLPYDLKRWLNNQQVRIALNKFGYFYEVANIEPNELFFLDFHDENARHFLKLALRKTNDCVHTYYLNCNFKKYFSTNILKFCLKFIPFIIYKIKYYFYTFIKKSLKLLSKDFHDAKVKYFYISEVYKPILLKKNKKYIFLKPHSSGSVDNDWARSLDERLYHHRGSISTLLNLISIKYSNHKILMLGVDLVKGGYFFQKQLDDHYSKYNRGRDWTYDKMLKQNKHFTAIKYQGTTIFEAFEFMLGNLKNSNNDVFAFPHCNAEIFAKDVEPFDLSLINDK